MKEKHRNSQKRIYIKDGLYFITCKTQGSFPYFEEKIFCDLFIENLKLCKQLKEFYLYAWVLVYDHFHLLVRPFGESGISEVMHFLKRNMSRGINIVMNDNIYDSPEGEDYNPRLQRWIDYIRQKWLLKFRFNIKYLNQNPFPHFRWQKSFHDHYIRGYTDFTRHMNYIVNNPQKHDLPDDWPYTFTNPKYEDLIDEA